MDERRANHGSKVGWVALSAVAGLAVAGAVGVVRARRRKGRLAESDGRPEAASGVITIGRPASEIYAFWKRPERWSQFMGDLQSAEAAGDGSIRLSVNGPVKTPMTWLLRVVEEQKNELLRWQATTEGGDELFSSRLHLQRAPGGRGTEVSLQIEPPSAGGLAGAAARLIHATVKFWTKVRVQNDLRRLKQLIETGGLTKSDASIHRGPHAGQPSDESRRELNGGGFATSLPGGNLAGSVAGSVE